MSSLDSLPNSSRALLAGQFMNPNSTLRYGMVENVPSPEAEEALGALVDAGLLSRTVERSGAILYALTEEGKNSDRRPPGKTVEEMWDFMEKHGRFRMSVLKSSEQEISL